MTAQAVDRLLLYRDFPGCYANFTAAPFFQLFPSSSNLSLTSQLLSCCPTLNIRLECQIFWGLFIKLAFMIRGTLHVLPYKKEKSSFVRDKIIFFSFGHCDVRTNPVEIPSSKLVVSLLEVENSCLLSSHSLDIFKKLNQFSCCCWNFKEKLFQTTTAFFH
jgi:hypothetical protein